MAISRMQHRGRERSCTLLLLAIIIIIVIVIIIYVSYTYKNNDSSIFVVASPSSQSFSPISFRSSCPGKPGNDNRAPNMRYGFGLWKMIIMIINMVSVHVVHSFNG